MNDQARPRFIDLPIVTAPEIASLPDGLYRLGGSRIAEKFYRPDTDTWAHDVRVGTIVRIDRGTEIPSGCDCTIENGRRVITGEVPFDE